MQCPHCGFEAADDALSCPACGKSLTARDTPPRPEGLDEATTVMPQPVAEQPTMVQPVEQPTIVQPVEQPTVVQPVEQPTVVQPAAVPAPQLEAPAGEAYRPAASAVPTAVPESSPQTAYVPSQFDGGVPVQPQKSSGGLGRILLGVAVVAVLAVGIFGVGTITGLIGSPSPDPDPTVIESDWDELCVDSNNNPTAFAVTELDGTDLVKLLESLGFKFKSSNKTFVSRDGNNGLFVNSFEGGVEEELDEAAIRALAKAGKGSPVRYGIVVDADNYSSHDSALDEMVPMEIDGFWLDDLSALGIAKSDSGEEFLIYFEADEDAGLDYCHIFNEDAIKAGFFNDFAGVELGTSMADIRSFISDEPADVDVQAEEPEDAVVDDGNDGSSDTYGMTTVTADAIKLKGVRTDKDWNGKDCVVVTLDFTNTTDETVTFGFVCNMTVFQNGVSLSQTFLENDENDNYYTDLRPGATVTIDVAYEIKDKSDVEVEISNFWDYESNEPLVVETYKL